MENYTELHRICINVFETVSKTTLVFVLPLFMVRVVFANILGEGHKIFSFIKGLVLYFALSAGFPLIVEMLFSIPASFMPSPNSTFETLMTADFPLQSMIPNSVNRLFEVILACLYWIVYYLHVFFMIIMCSMAPLVFLTSTLLGIGMGIEIFFGLLIVGSSWPIIWYGFDQVHLTLVSAQTDDFAAKCLELLLTLLKGIAPMSFAYVAIQSPPGKAITSTARMAANIATKGAPQLLRYTKSNSSGAIQKSNLNTKTTNKDTLKESGSKPQPIATSPNQDSLKASREQYKNGVKQNANLRPRNT